VLCPQKVKHRITTGPLNSAERYMPYIIENRYSVARKNQANFKKNFF
jgi:hypothetical protein